MNAPQNYRFTVEGTVTESVRNWFSDMDLSLEQDKIFISGVMFDQASVHGIIARIRDLGLTLIKVERIA